MCPSTCPVLYFHNCILYLLNSVPVKCSVLYFCNFILYLLNSVPVWCSVLSATIKRREIGLGQNSFHNMYFSNMFHITYLCIYLTYLKSIFGLSTISTFVKYLSVQPIFGLAHNSEKRRVHFIHLKVCTPRPWWMCSKNRKDHFCSAPKLFQMIWIFRGGL